MLFWIMCAALVAVVSAAILAPFWRARRDARGADAAADPTQTAASYDLRVYREQLRDVDRDLERGVIGHDDAARLRTEIGRKVLDADRRLAEGTTAGGATIATSGRRQLAGFGGLVAVAVMLATTLVLYLREGAPGLSDLPMTRRIETANTLYSNRPSQAEAEETAEQPAPATPDTEYAELIGELRRVASERPDDAEGQALLAQSELRLGNIIAARVAQQRLVDLRGDKATGQDLTQLAALMIQAAGGTVTPEAEQTLARALKVQPDNPQARYMVGIMQAQNGRPDRTFPIWARLLEEGPADAPWIAPIQASIADLAWLAGQPDYVPPTAGPTAEQMQAAEAMSPEERQQMVIGMVEQLESRLATEGGSPDEWARLISALVVIGREDQAARIWAEAQTRFGDQPEAIATIRAAAEQAGLTE